MEVSKNKRKSIKFTDQRSLHAHSRKLKYEEIVKAIGVY